MVRVNCLPVFGRRAKSIKAVLGSEMKDNTKGMCRSAELNSAKEKNILVKDLRLNDSLDSSTLPCPPFVDPVTGVTLTDASFGHPIAKLHDTVRKDSGDDVFLMSSILKQTHEVEFLTRGIGSPLSCGDEDSGEESGSEASGTEINRDFASYLVLEDGNDGALSNFTSETVDTTVKQEQFYGEGPNTVSYPFETSPVVAASDALAGPVSDPEIYQRENSRCGSPVLTLNESPVILSLGDMDMLTSQQNYELQSCDAISRVSESADKVLHDVKHGSKPFCELNESSAFAEQVFYKDHLQSDSDEGDFPQLSVVDQSIVETAESTLQGPINDSNFSMDESVHSRVMKWINNVQLLDYHMEGNHGLDLTLQMDDENNDEIKIVMNSHQQVAKTMSIDQLLANSALRSLNRSSTVAHLSGLGLRETPLMGTFIFLKTLNLSANHIARILPGCLPRSLHCLDLSRNKIFTIEGFRELTRLRVLNLSDNRISRVGRGLANCTHIKELYLAGNRIAEVEGFHRLLKLTVLDLSYNKLTTSKALGQLAANYSSLLALNLLGNPIVVNCGEEQMRKMLSTLTPHVTYFNKQPIKAILVREAAVDGVAKAALGIQRGGMKRVSVPLSGMSHQKLPGSRKNAQKRLEFPSSGHVSSNSSKMPKPRRHHHRYQDHQANDSCKRGKGGYREKLLRLLSMDRAGVPVMHRSRSESAFQE